MRVFNMAFWEGNTMGSDDFFWGLPGGQNLPDTFIFSQPYFDPVLILGAHNLNRSIRGMCARSFEANSNLH